MNNLQTAINYEHNYLESAGRTDRAHLREAIAEQGADSVVRLCLWRND